MSNQARRILVIEDEPGLVMTLSDRLESEGFEVHSRMDGNSGYECARSGAFDLILLDVMLPVMSGVEVCRLLRRERVDTPVLMLTARGQVVDKVVGLQIGADDYVVKPFEMPELLARIGALLRRSEWQAPPVSPEVYRFGDVSVNLKSAEVFRDGQPVTLSAREFHLLRYLIEHRGTLVTRDQLLRQVWGYEAVPATRTVDVHVTWLRQKLEPNSKHPQHIVTVRGLGYRFAD